MLTQTFSGLFRLYSYQLDFIFDWTLQKQRLEQNGKLRTNRRWSKNKSTIWNSESGQSCFPVCSRGANTTHTQCRRIKVLMVDRSFWRPKFGNMFECVILIADYMLIVLLHWYRVVLRTLIWLTSFLLLCTCLYLPEKYDSYSILSMGSIEPGILIKKNC